MSEGDTIEEALANIKEALDGVIETMIDHNISLHTNKQGNIIGFHTKIEASLEQAKKDYKAGKTRTLVTYEELVRKRYINFGL